MLKIIGQKLLSTLITVSVTAGLFFVLFLGIKYSSAFKNEVVLKASDVNEQDSNSRQVYQLPSLDKQNNIPDNNFLQAALPDLNKYNLSQGDIKNISQALNIDATSTKAQIEGIKTLQTQASNLFKDNPEIAEVFNFSPLSDRDIKIYNSKDAGEKYLSGVSEYFKKDLPENALPPQLILLLKILQKNPGAFPEIDLKNVDLQDPQLDSFLNLELYIKSYNQLLSDIKSLPVPQPLVDLHKQEVLTLQTTVSSLTAIKKYPENQLVALLSFQSLSAATNQLNGKLVDFKNSLKTNWAPQN